MSDSDDIGLEWWRVTAIIVLTIFTLAVVGPACLIIDGLFGTKLGERVFGP